MRPVTAMRRSAVGLAMVVGLGVISPAGVMAECTGQTNAFPPLAAVAPTARVVVIGTVEKREGASGPPFDAFWLRVDETLAGDPGERIEILRVYSGLPLHGQEACRNDAAIYARVGDRLAVALDGRYRGYRDVNTVAWIGKRPNDLTRAETLTLAQARRAVLGLPDTSSVGAVTMLDRVAGSIRSIVQRFLGVAGLG